MPKLLIAAFFLLGGLLILGFQFSNGAFDSDLGGDPDEAAHAVTALMVHDYLWFGLGSAPLEFASRYYDSFPKVALGHYPPGYYLPAAAALSLWCDPNALIALQAVWASALMIVGYLFARRWITGGDGLLAVLPALMIVSLSQVIHVGFHVMADLQLAVTVFAALWAWHSYLHCPSWKAALSFGGLAAVAILTKGSAMGLAGVPLISLVLGRRWSDLKRSHWWGAGLPVVLLAGPWMLYSVRFTQEGFVDQHPLDFFFDAVRYYADALPRVLGWPMIVLILLAFARLTWDSLRGSIESVRLVLWAGCLSMQGIVMVVPTGYSDRYLLPSLLPAVLLVLIEVCYWLPGGSLKSQRPQRLQWARRVVVAALVIITAVLTHRVRPKHVSGFGEVVERLATDQGAGGKHRWLVASDPRGEGAVIAAAAFFTEDRLSGALSVQRGSKTLVDTDWLGKSYQPKFSDASSLLALLDEKQIQAVLVDLSLPFEKILAHEKSLKNALDGSDSGWQLAWKQEIHRGWGIPVGDLWVYRRSSPGGDFAK